MPRSGMFLVARKLLNSTRKASKCPNPESLPGSGVTGGWPHVEAFA